MALLPKPPVLPGGPGDKVQHMLAFATLGALAAAGWRDQPAWRLLACLAAFGGFIELAQSIPALHRDAQFADWLTDSIAAVAAIAAVRFCLPTDRPVQ